MSTRLILLGLLRDKPLYGYEIKQIVEAEMGTWTSIAFGSIYFALKKLRAEGFVEKIGTEKDGDRPSRHIYQITEAGKREFQRLLVLIWQEVESPHFDLDVGWYFLESLSKEEIRNYLEMRVESLRQMMDEQKASQDLTMTQIKMPRYLNEVFEHSLVHIRAELAWTMSLIEKMDEGEFPFSE
ncbi:MAG: PadR family transcriptional regulator [Anaerolineaceae bacterium]|nr:PadR family transcriptional regulator [Anaerolineaceae bacterium]